MGRLGCLSFVGKDGVGRLGCLSSAGEDSVGKLGSLSLAGRDAGKPILFGVCPAAVEASPTASHLFKADLILQIRLSKSAFF